MTRDFREGHRVHVHDEVRGVDSFGTILVVPPRPDIVYVQLDDGPVSDWFLVEDVERLEHVT